MFKNTSSCFQEIKFPVYSSIHTELIKKKKTQQEKANKQIKIINKQTNKNATPNPINPPSPQKTNQPPNHKPRRYVICFALTYNILQGKHLLCYRKKFFFTHIFLY